MTWKTTCVILCRSPMCQQISFQNPLRFGLHKTSEGLLCCPILDMDRSSTSQRWKINSSRDMENLEAKSSAWALCHIPQSIDIQAVAIKPKIQQPAINSVFWYLAIIASIHFFSNLWCPYLALVWDMTRQNSFCSSHASEPWAPLT